jgi:hypothetical protein
MTQGFIALDGIGKTRFLFGRLILGKTDFPHTDFE